jgi:hypothetical protein
MFLLLTPITEEHFGSTIEDLAEALMDEEGCSFIESTDAKGNKVLFARNPDFQQLVRLRATYNLHGKIIGVESLLSPLTKAV